MRPVLFHSLPTKTSLVTGRKLCFSYLHRNKDYKTNHYLSGCNLEKNVIDLSFPLHPTPRKRIVIMFLYPLSSNVPSIRRKKIIMFLHFSGPSPLIKQVFLASQRDVGELTCRKTFSPSFSLSQSLLGN